MQSLHNVLIMCGGPATVIFYRICCSVLVLQIVLEWVSFKFIYQSTFLFIFSQTTSDKTRVNKMSPKPTGDPKIFPSTALLALNVGSALSRRSMLGRGSWWFHNFLEVCGMKIVTLANPLTTDQHWPSGGGCVWLRQLRPDKKGLGGQSFVKCCLWNLDRHKKVMGRWRKQTPV